MDSLSLVDLYFVVKDMGVLHVRGIAGSKHLLVDAYRADVRDNGEVHVSPEPELTVVPMGYVIRHRLFTQMADAVNYAREILTP